MNKNQYKYLVINDIDKLWGLTVDTVGVHKIEPDYEDYPPRDVHPESYTFDINNGRVLDSYQLIYYTKGAGFLYYGSADKCIRISAGDMVLLRPGVWHSYFPDKKVGWEEYWIGFTGSAMDMQLNSELLNKGQAIYKVGVHEDIIDLYEKAIDIATREKSSYQQAVSGIAMLLLGLMVYRNRNLRLPDKAVRDSINKAKTILHADFLENIDFEQVADDVNMSYSYFRKMFKIYTGMSPAHYVLNLKFQHAKRLLASTDMPIKEISYTINYDNISNFTSVFKKHVGCSPGEYRKRCRGIEV